MGNVIISFVKGSEPEAGDSDADQQVEEALARRGLRTLHRRPPPPPPQQVTGKEGEEPLSQGGRLTAPAVLEALRNPARPGNIGMLSVVQQ